LASARSAQCATTICLFPDILGLCGGTFDDPNWFDRSQGKCRLIFTRSAQRGVVLPPGVDLHEAHMLRLDGTLNEPIVLAHALIVAHGGYRAG